MFAWKRLSEKGEGRDKEREGETRRAGRDKETEKKTERKRERYAAKYCAASGSMDNRACSIIHGGSVHIGTPPSLIADTSNPYIQPSCWPRPN